MKAIADTMGVARSHLVELKRNLPAVKRAYRVMRQNDCCSCDMRANDHNSLTKTR
jgi:hypothetical protein